jgi:hypothetical protein
MNSSIHQIKNSIKSLANRVEQIGNRISGTEHKAELDQAVKEREKRRPTKITQ